MGMSEKEFYDSSMRSVMNRVDGFSQEVKSRERQEWDRTRWLASVVVNLVSKRTVKPGDLLKLPWDAESLERPLTKEEREERFAEMDRRMAERFGKTTDG